MSNLELFIYVVSRLNSDVQVIQDSLGTNISMFIRGFLAVVVIITVMCLISLPLTGTVFSAIIPIICVVICIVTVMRRIQKQIQEEKAKMNTIAEECFANIRTVKAF